MTRTVLTEIMASVFVLGTLAGVYVMAALARVTRNADVDEWQWEREMLGDALCVAVAHDRSHQSDNVLREHPLDVV